MKNSKKTRLLTFVLLAFTLFSLLVLHSFARENEAEEPQPEGQFVVEEEERGFFNTIIYWRENGGLVCDLFGEKTAGTLNGKPAVGVRIPFLPYTLTYLLMIIFSYVMGSINFGVLISRKMYKDDVRKHGSGNAGMTNVLRTYGKKAAILTLLGDMGKSAVCALLGTTLAGNGCGYIAVLFCLVGHAFPVFFHFKGGKSVAATFGGMIVLEPIAALILGLIFFTIVLGTKYVSLGSIITACLIPLIVNGMWRIGLTHRMASFDYFIVTICCVLYAVFIVWLHRANMKRLANGEENKTYLFKKKEKSE